MSRRASLRWLFAVLVALFALGSGRGQAPLAKPSAQKYPFANPPLEIYDRLGKTGVGKFEPLTTSDKKFLATFWATRTAKPVKNLPPADDEAVTAHLIASGVSDPGTRAGYLRKFTDLVAAAERATSGATSDAQKADRLLRFLHKEALAKGYEEKQTSLAAVFDTGKYNCVSSSCLYYLVGTRLGLKLQPILIAGTGAAAGHAAVDLVDGTRRIQIEPTNPDGYDWSTKLKKPGVRAIGPLPDRKKAYDCDGFGLAGSIASNLGVAAAKADPPRPVEAIRWGTIALALDPTDAPAAENLVSSISNWGLRLEKQANYEDALAVYAFGRSALGPHKTLDHNHAVVWERYLDAVFAGGEVAEGVKLLPRAATAFPKEKRFTDPALWVARAAHRTAEKDGWASGLAYADLAMRDLTGNAASDVRAWKDAARRKWSEQLLKKGDAAGSLKVIADGLAANPTSKELRNGLAYHTQEALKVLDVKNGADATVAHFKELCEMFPKEKGVREMGLGHAMGVVEKLADKKKFDEAMKAATTYAPLAGDRADGLKCLAYERCARVLSKDEKWDDALAKYAEGLQAFPRSEQLLGSATTTIDQWAHQAIDGGKRDWAEAIKRYDAGLKILPDSQYLKDKRAICQNQLDRKK